MKKLFFQMLAWFFALVGFSQLFWVGLSTFLNVPREMDVFNGTFHYSHSLVSIGKLLLDSPPPLVLLWVAIFAWFAIFVVQVGKVILRIGEFR